MRLKSMTGFGRAALHFPIGYFSIQIQGGNRRHLEVNTLLPKELSHLESDVRKWISEKVARGQVTLSLNWRAEGAQSLKVIPNFSLAKELKEGYTKLQAALGIDSPVTLELLSREKNLFLYQEELEEEGKIKEALKETLFLALKNFEETRNIEGEALAKDFHMRITLLQKFIQEIELNTKDLVAHQREKLKVKLEEFFKGSKENEEKIIREIVIFAEKIDITEEIIRFRHHLHKLQETLEQPIDASLDGKGKRLDFILQELFREINTMGSKTASHLISNCVVDAKCELEKLREQVQNIE